MKTAGAAPTQEGPTEGRTITDPRGRHRVGWSLALLAMLAFSFAISAVESPRVSTLPILDLLVKKGGHFAGYGILGFLFTMAIWAWEPRAARIRDAVRHLGSLERVAFLAVVLWALSDEFHQSLSPHRTPALYDVAIDSAGAALGIWLSVRLRARWSGAAQGD